MKSSIRVDSCLAAAVALFGATLLWRLLTFSGFSNDHYAYLALAQQMLLGDRPIRDFYDPGWPLKYLISAAAWRVAGNAMWVEWSIMAGAIALGSALTTIAAHRLAGSLPVAVLVATVQMLMTPRSYSYPKIVAYAAFAVVIVAGASLSRKRLAALGAVIALAFLLRHDHGVWIGVAAVAYLVLASFDDSVGALSRRLAVVGGTTALVLLPWALFVVVNGGLTAYFSTAVEFARAEANASMLRAWPSFTPAQDAGAHADAWLFWLFWTLPAGAGALALRRWHRGEERWRGELAAVGALVILAAGVNAGFLRDVLRTRFADAIVPAALLGSWLLGAAFASVGARGRVRYAARAVAVLVVLLSVAAIGRATELPDRIERTNINAGAAGMYRRFVEIVAVLQMPHRQDRMPPSRFSEALMPFYAYLDRCTSLDDRLIVTGEHPDIVVLSGRGFSGDGVVFGAWYSSAANQNRTLQQLRRRPALFVVLLDEAGFRKRFPVIAQYVDEEYEAFATERGPGIDVPILVHRGRPAGGRDGESGWPCFRGGHAHSADQAGRVENRISVRSLPGMDARLTTRARRSSRPRKFSSV